MNPTHSSQPTGWYRVRWETDVFRAGSPDDAAVDARLRMKHSFDDGTNIALQVAAVLDHVETIGPWQDVYLDCAGQPYDDDNVGEGS